MNNQISLGGENSIATLQWLKPVCLAAALSFGAGAQAAPSLTASDVTFQSGQPVSVALNFNFDGAVTFEAFDLFVTFDNALLKINPSTPFTVTGGSFVGDTSEQISYVDNGSGAYALSYLPSALPNVGATSTLQLTLNLTAQPAFAVGQTTDLTASFIYATSADPFSTVDLSSSAHLTASAVPEPESLALLLAGVGLVAAWGRRRVATSTKA